VLSAGCEIPCSAAARPRLPVREVLQHVGYPGPDIPKHEREQLYLHLHEEQWTSLQVTAVSAELK